MKTVLDVLLLYLPAFIANGTPVVFVAIPWVKKHNMPVLPRLLGTHKTWMGLASGIAMGAVTGWILHVISLPDSTASQMYDDAGFSLFFGALLGLGALLGDAGKSLFKRTLGIPPGGWLPILDAIDYVVGALIIALPFHIPTVTEGVILLALGWLLSAASNLTSYKLGIKRVWY